MLLINSYTIVALKRSQKEEVVKELTHVFDNSKSVVFARFNKLTVEESNTMRRELQKKHVDFKVAKKTLTSLALQNSSLKSELHPIEGQIAVAYSDDEIATAREIYAFQKKYNDKLFIEGGLFQGNLKNKAQMIEIAQIPDMQTLRGMFVNIINSPIQRIVIALNQIAQIK